MKKAILYALTYLAIQLIVLSIVQGLYTLFSGKSGSELPAMGLIAMMTAYNVVAMVLFLGLKWTVVSRDYVRSRPWAVLFWCMLAAVGAIIPSVAFQELMPELPNVSEAHLGMILRNRWGYFAIGLLAPIAEELVFRGAVLRALLGWARHHWTAIALSALLFALIHCNPAQMPHAFIVGLLLGWMYYRTDSIVPGVAYHWVNNTVAYIMYNLYPSSSIRLVDVMGSQGKVAAAVAFSLCILLPALYQLNLRLKKAHSVQTSI